jgi:hypothetical protein
MKNHYKSKSRKQKMYKMKGCSSTRKNRYGGKGMSNLASVQPAVDGDFNLAYPYKGPVLPNTTLAYTGKGGKSNFFPMLDNPSYLAVKTSNVNGANPLYPNTGPPPNGFNFLNPLQQIRGGGSGCGCDTFPFMNGGSSKHREGCKCSSCKMKGGAMKGGGGCSTGNNGIPYPNGLVGKPFVDPSNLPGAKGISGDANYYSLNKYIPDVSRQMIDVGANKPFLGFWGVKGGRRQKKTRKQCGGTLSNFIGQDIINLGRQFTYGLGTAFNALNGTPGPVNPLPWKGQLVQQV